MRANVLDKAQLQEALACATQTLGGLDVLINGAGGNKKEATCNPQTSFFDLPPEAIRWVFDLNCLGTMLPCQVFGRHRAQTKQGVIINIASMNAFRPLTNIAAYSSAKAAVKNFTEWLATYMAQNHSTKIRVNEIRPGFFPTLQNADLINKTPGTLTATRGSDILGKTPMKRYGKPEELIGAIAYLCSPSASFTTGSSIAIDGGFGSFSGV